MKLGGLIKVCFNETYSKVLIGKNLSIQNGLKQGDALSSLLFNFALECHQEGPRKSGSTATEWNTSAPGLC
jgi:hypothetical protein